MHPNGVVFQSGTVYFPAMTKDRRTNLLAAALVFLAAAAFYWHTLGFGFVWDDYAVIVHNQGVRSLDGALGRFVEERGGAGSAYDPSELNLHNYRPLRTLAHAVVFRCVGLDPRWFHALNVAAHALACALLLLLLLRLVGSLPGALCGALFFAFHPVNTEVVCWAKEFEDSLAAAFLLSSFLLLLAGEGRAGRPRWLLFAGAMLCYALALLSKQSVVFFPLFLALCWALWRRGRWRRWGLAALATGGLAAAGVAVSSWVVGSVAQGGYLTGDFWTTILSMPRVLLRYARLELAPAGLLADYQDFPRAAGLDDLRAWAFAAAFLAVFAALTWLFHKARALEGWLWFCCALLPFSNLVAMVQLGAERFLYLPTIGFAWVFAAVVAKWPLPGRLWRWLPAALLLALALVAWQRSWVWADELELWRATAAQAPDAERPRENLVKACLRAGLPEEALREAADLVRRHPEPRCGNLYAYVLFENGRFEPSLAILGRNGAHDVLNMLGARAVELKRPDLARRCFAAACGLAPGNLSYRHNLGLLEKQFPALK